jgi:hypothetical protein
MTERKISSLNNKGILKFAQSSLAVSNEKIYLLDNSTKILSVLNTDLDLLKEIFLSAKVDYGNILVVEGKPVILSNENGKLAIFTIEVSLQYSTKSTDIDISSIDLRTSAIDKDKVYLYDYIRGKIIVKNRKNIK